MNTQAVAESLARSFHGMYEARAGSTIPWEDMPEKNRALMVATAKSLLELGIIHAGSMCVAGKPVCTPRPMCPMSPEDVACGTDSCAWYDSDYGECAVSVISGKLCLIATNYE